MNTSTESCKQDDIYVMWQRKRVRGRSVWVSDDGQISIRHPLMPKINL